ncbi:iron ABC transporter permease [Romboutsia maritimum]|uniref:Iron ABC transporter permease n=1 Tax=Romboutsia maritimum TaxID=2020948 RepID=A0A371IX15_9FIRM|nr:iron ABC transporter permease [Romboutsia maritimum]RDY25024.1 iron ABC transporter permease [Romboutsia maritimum]
MNQVASNNLRIDKKNSYEKRKYKNLMILVGLSFLLVLTSILSISIGASSVDASTVAEVVMNVFNKSLSVSQVDKIVVLNIRLPRVFVAIFAGIALSNAGLLMQGIFQNPLVSPYTLGVSNGAAFGAALSIILGTPLSFLGSYKVPIFAFIFSIITMLMVYVISIIAKNSSKTLILSGVAIGYLFSAMVSFLKYVSDTDELPEIVFWMMGSLSGIEWESIAIIVVIVVISFIIMMRYAWDLNVMSLGEESALSLGVNFNKIKNISIILSTLMTAVAVAFTGIIGFVGLIAPHISRMIIGSDYRYLVPTSSLIGALLLLVSDTVARNIIAPTELPIGIITSFIGVPFFLYLIIKQKRG